jgi:hypothetical protein
VTAAWARPTATASQTRRQAVVHPQSRRPAGRVHRQRSSPDAPSLHEQFIYSCVSTVHLVTSAK